MSNSLDPDQARHYVGPDLGPNCLQRFEGYIDIVLIFFHVLVLQEYWVLTESRIPLKLVLECVRIVALSSSSHVRLYKTESAVFFYCRLSVFLKDPFFQIISTNHLHRTILHTTTAPHRLTLIQLSSRTSSLKNGVLYMQ